MEVLGQLEGASALLFKSSHYPGELVACRRGSPLIVGIRKESGNGVQPDKFEAFLASDGAAVVEHTKQCVPPISLVPSCASQHLVFACPSPTAGFSPHVPVPCQPKTQYFALVFCAPESQYRTNTHVQTSAKAAFNVELFIKPFSDLL